jgi:folate-binding protein YgfZ
MLASFLVFRSGADYQLQLSADLLPHDRQATADVRPAQQGDGSPTFPAAAKSSVSPVRTRQPPCRRSACRYPAAPLRTAVCAAGLVIRLEGSSFRDRRRHRATPRRSGGNWLRTPARWAAPVWQWLDIQAGIPLITERTREEFVPQMANFEQLGGVSFHKGCYPGQEIIARTQYLGKVKRHLYRAHSASPLAAGDTIYSARQPGPSLRHGHQCRPGTRAAGGYDALAVVQENFVAGGDLALAAPGGPRVDLELLDS